MAGKAVAAKKECALIYRRCSNRVNRTCRAERDGGLYVTGSGLASRAGFDSRLNVAAYVIKVEDDRLCNLIRQAFIKAHDVVAALQVERASGVSK